MNGWREQYALVLDFEAAELGKALVELDNAHAILETRGSSRCAEVRATASALRMEIQSMVAEARDLRAAGRPDITVLPMSVTTRRLRP